MAFSRLLSFRLHHSPTSPLFYDNSPTPTGEFSFILTYMNITAAIPTRGLIFARTIRSLQQNGIYDPITIEGMPMPECHESAVFAALQRVTDAILLMEEDMELPSNAISEMVSKMNDGFDIVAIDYPVDNGCSTICYRGDEILWCGLGATLINRKVFETIKRPWFDNSYSYRIESEDPLILEKINVPNKYGGHDINFCLKSIEAGFKIGTINKKAKHLRCSHLERGKTNNEVFEIRELKLEKEQRYASS